MRYAAAIVVGLLVANAHAEEMGVLRKMSDNKFVTQPGLPPCVTMAAQSGDPAKGPFILLFKAKAGCLIPWHWHTPTENVMMVNGAAKVEMKDKGPAATLGPGGYAMMPGKHVHQFRCTSPCTAFLSSDAAFDIHYVDATGNEIPPETALAKKK